MNLVVIDGSYGEGGGQILRTSLTLSVLTCKPMHITNIRSGRKKSGLRPQHLTAVKSAGLICQAQIEGAKLNSTDLKFFPSALQGGNFSVDISADQPSAGSITLIFQTIFPALLFAPKPSKVDIVHGGSHVPFSPPYEYIDRVFLPTVRQMGALGKLTLLKAGWFPKGGGEATAQIEPTVQQLNPISLTERKELKKIYVLSALSNLNRSIAIRQANQTANRLLEMGFPQSNIEVNICELPSPSKGTITFIMAVFENCVAGFSSVGELGKPAEQVANEAVDSFANYWKTNAPVDKHLADQLLLFMALAKGHSLIQTQELSQHLLTNIWVIERFLPVRFEVQGRLGDVATVGIEGIGMMR